jgi:hypothetical protein
MLTVSGNMNHGDTSVIKMRGSGSAYDRIALTAPFTTMTIGGSAKLEVVFKGTAPDPMSPGAIWHNVFTAPSISAASTPYDPEDISTSGSWGTTWSKISELVGGNSVRLRFMR